MKPERWDEIERIYLSALDLPEAEREAFVRASCGEDEELLTTVLGMLGGSGEGFLDPPTPPPVGELPPDLPRSLGDFELLERIGSGGMGAVVFRAWQRSLARQVAIKVLPRGMHLANEVERFHREARAGAKLHHPGIVSVITTGREGDVFWFAMDLVDGHDLTHELKDLRAEAKGGESTMIRLPSTRAHGYFREVARIVRDIADALEHAHKNGVVHRDVKPSNVLLDTEGKVRLIDFGLALDVELSTITQVGVVAGTLPYMSPEQARAKRIEIDHRTDVYSLGAILYELLTLRQPHSGGTKHEVISKIIHEEAQAPRRINTRIPRDLETICEGAMAKLPRERYGSAAELRDDLDRFLNHEAILRRPPGLGRRVMRRVRRHRIPLGAAGIALIGLVAGGWAVAGHVEGARLDALTHLSVRALDASGSPTGAEVLLREVDPFTTMPGERVALGPTPLPPTPLEDGYYRVVVVFEAGGFREVPLLADGIEESIELVVARRADEDALTDGMVRIEPGPWRVPDDALPREISGLEVDLEGLWVSRTEVSNAEYAGFARATGHRLPLLWDEAEDLEAFLAEHGDLPVSGVSFEDMVAYTTWAGMRLPTAVEWQRLAGGPDGWPLPRNPDPGGPRIGNLGRENPPATTRGERWERYLRMAVPVDAAPLEATTVEGLLHTYGNVYEVTESLPLDPQPERGTVVRAYDRLLYGGAWFSAPPIGTMRNQAFEPIGDRDAYHGFRCVKSLSP